MQQDLRTSPQIRLDEERNTSDQRGSLAAPVTLSQFSIQKERGRAANRDRSAPHQHLQDTFLSDVHAHSAVLLEISIQSRRTEMKMRESGSIRQTERKNLMLARFPRCVQGRSPLFADVRAWNEWNFPSEAGDEACGGAPSAAPPLPLDQYAYSSFLSPVRTAEIKKRSFPAAA